MVDIACSTAAAAVGAAAGADVSLVGAQRRVVVLRALVDRGGYRQRQMVRHVALQHAMQQRSPHPSVAIGEGVDRLKLQM